MNNYNLLLLFKTSKRHGISDSSPRNLVKNVPYAPTQTFIIFCFLLIKIFYCTAYANLYLKINGHIL